MPRSYAPKPQPPVVESHLSTPKKCFVAALLSGVIWFGDLGKVLVVYVIYEEHHLNRIVAIYSVQKGYPRRICS